MMIKKIRELELAIRFVALERWYDNLALVLFLLLAGINIIAWDAKIDSVFVGIWQIVFVVNSYRLQRQKEVLKKVRGIEVNKAMSLAYKLVRLKNLTLKNGDTYFQSFRTVKGQGEEGIICLRCNLVSWNKNDVEKKYCGNCHAFHPIPEKYDSDKRGEQNEAI